MVPFIYMSSLTFTLLDFFVPMLGHTPVKTNSNVFLGVLCSATTAILAFNGLGKTPMRLRIQDTARTWYNSDMTENRSDAGYCLWPQDPNVLEYLSEISKVHPQVGNYKISDVSSCPDLYCSQPLYRYPSGFSQIPWIWRSDKIHQTLKDEVEMRIRKRQVVQPGMFKIELIFQGPPLNSLALRTAQNWEMRKIVLATANETFGAIDRFDKQLCYINLCKGYFAKDLHMTVILEETLPNIFVNESNFKSDLMDVFLVGHIMRDVNNSKFKDFVQKFPSWTDVHSWTSIVKQYTVTTHS
ncbi:unnamed protein product [Allacma fusca]|uniref:Endoplasmic reticulum metallopeptidase 1-like C-terminal domain-containing protein n=1 Tax=Allacma fusca TaxID=39272 RepID=A0A8J2PLY5_9HEXA|nr:unnamed protein product [Allacma fusca]